VGEGWCGICIVIFLEQIAWCNSIFICRLSQETVHLHIQQTRMALLYSYQLILLVGQGYHLINTLLCPHQLNFTKKYSHSFQCGGSWIAYTDLGSQKSDIGTRRIYINCNHIFIFGLIILVHFCNHSYFVQTDILGKISYNSKWKVVISYWEISHKYIYILIWPITITHVEFMFGFLGGQVKAVWYFYTSRVIAKL